ncbi:MAG: hypothetical protein AB1634_08805 [Thermodesulfobacteriota bacterium]
MMKTFVLFMTLLASTYAYAGSEISVSVVENQRESNKSVYISDTALGYGETIYVTERAPGYGTTFYITDNPSLADIVLKQPKDGPSSADLRLYIHSSNPGYGTSIYITDRAPGYGKTVYFAPRNPGYGKSIFIEDPLLRFNKKVIATMLLMLGVI